MLPSYYEAIRPLPDQERLIMLDAIFDYVFLEKEPVDLPPILQGYFVLLRPNIDSSIRNYSASVENGKKGGRPPKSKPNGNPAETQGKPNGKRDKEKDKEKDMESIKADKPPRPRFIAPSIDEVRQYCKERKNGVDPETFVDFYGSKGWKVGKETMKDWKAAVRTWERREGKNATEEKHETIVF